MSDLDNLKTMLDRIGLQFNEDPEKDGPRITYYIGDTYMVFFFDHNGCLEGVDAVV